MIKNGEIVLADTTMLIEAYELKTLNAILGNYKLETVEICWEEFCTGDKSPPKIDLDKISKRLTIRKVSQREYVEAALKSPHFQHIDRGEKQLLAHANSRQGEWRITSQDTACVRVGYELGIIDRFVSLQEMIESVGVKKANLREHFTKNWLTEVRTRLMQGTL